MNIVYYLSQYQDSAGEILFNRVLSMILQDG